MIYFVRHGQSEANKIGLFAGQRENSALTLQGKEQAKIAAQNIQSEIPRVDRIVYSPLQRTLETATIIAEKIGFNPDAIQIDHRVIEYDMGSLTGTPFHNISSITLTSAQGAENPKQFYNRVYSCLKELSKLQETILIVSHAGVGRMVETIKNNTAAELFYDLPAYPNGSIIKIDLSI
ncbi:MAG: hypothetical protein A3I29_04475 [Candidatus Magasanikbacteria bacterium RIFCSPLOWO2_02_FULL_44_11]|uniref:Phosphoglycerate mutase n=2 Tax=Candidatus Magasanikiibacteriota TaxID=1752731 RepID=A0A1F6NAB2_9BACT|nr:MAG: hypothetical protein A3D53_03605 [Candidatus Magasanikbacteria bacterium RIFCSPHIGHO2_02_FULL_45_10]OGH80819.1 MAG: hypothetical protein A3I29_04475 [Candidatus Magasanikbacteria bacterium RIFCSPLOWO2_02_FULL_44_11]